MKKSSSNTKNRLWAGRTIFLDSLSCWSVKIIGLELEVPGHGRSGLQKVSPCHIFLPKVGTISLIVNPLITKLTFSLTS